MIVASYYGKLNVLWEEFHNHEPIIQCTCCSSVPRVIYMRIVMPLINLLHEFYRVLILITIVRCALIFFPKIHYALLIGLINWLFKPNGFA